jgi:hypothetical protein
MLTPLYGPLAWPSWRGKLAGLLLVLLLTGLTQVGGLLAWPALGLASRRTRRHRDALVLFVLFQALGLLLVPPLAEATGRVALPCWREGALGPRSWVYCVGHRRYAEPELAEEIVQIAALVAEQHPGTVVRYLDAGFPFLDGFPLLPHLSHHDGRKLDLALLYEDEDGEPIDGGGSPIGYFGYVPVPAGEQPACRPSLFDLRWDLPLLQPLLAPRLDEERTGTLIRVAARRPHIGKLLLEPHLQRRLSVTSDKVRFQGCRAARHDDHVHIQLR